MRVFITGATGFVGSHVVRDLVASGHQVVGLARSEAGASALAAAGAEAHPGSLEDLESLRRGAASAEAVIHLAFDHDFSKVAANCALDGRAIATIGRALSGSGVPLIVTSATGAVFTLGRPATEDDAPSPQIPRIAGEQAANALAAQGLRVAVVRLPQVHDPVKHGLVTRLIAVAREKGVSAYVGEGHNRWPAVHALDAARLYRLALEKSVAGARYHAVAEEGVPLREIAEAIGRGLKVPVVSISAEQAGDHFGWMGMFARADIPASGALTQERLGWRPREPGLLSDLKGARVFEAPA